MDLDPEYRYVGQYEDLFFDGQDAREGLPRTITRPLHTLPWQRRGLSESATVTRGSQYLLQVQSKYVILGK